MTSVFRGSGLSRFVFALLLVLPFQSPAWSNVIFDVSVTYVFPPSSPTATYSFSMEFASVPPPTKTISDLISSTPSNDFLNESLVVDGTPFTLNLDTQPSALSFSAPGNTIASFEATDSFSGPMFSINAVCALMTESLLECRFFDRTTGAFVGGGSAGVSEITVAERTATDVPISSSLLLLLSGFAGLWVSRLTTARRRSSIAA